RLISGRKVSLHRRSPVHLVVTDSSVAVEIEIDERGSSDVPAVVDEILSDAGGERTGSHTILIVDARLDAKAPDAPVDRRRGLQQLLRVGRRLVERLGISEQAEHEIAALLAEELDGAADAGREFPPRPSAGARDDLSESLHARQVAADRGAAGLRREVR